MRKDISSFLATTVATFLFVLSFAGLAHAAPTDVSVRIEGKSGTIFDRVVRTDARVIKSASDTTERTCDGTNLDANPEPGPTPTGASVDAMMITGQDFDGNWYDMYDDYFLTRWGPDEEDNMNAWWWGILVNREFTPVGGCQLLLDEGDEVLWVYDAFSDRPMLSLSGPAKAVVGEPIKVETSSFAGTPYPGASIIGLNAAAVPYAAGIVDATTSDSSGESNVTFTQPGWKRLKATDPGTGAIADAVPSNSIDICVERTSGSGCTDDAPSQIPAQIGQEPAVEIPEPEPTCEHDPTKCPEPEPTCQTDPSLCPKPEPTCDTDPSLCPKPEGRPAVQFGTVKVKRQNRGRSFQIKVRVNNDGNAPANGVRLCFTVSKRLGKVGCVKVGSLAVGASATRSIRLKARKSAAKGKASVSVRLSADGTKPKTKKINLRVGAKTRN